MPKIARLTRFVIKSCGGQELTRAEVTQTGLAEDHRYMLVKPNGVFISQRDYPKLCRAQSWINGETVMCIAPDLPQLSFPLGYYPGKVIDVEVHQQPFRAVVMAPEHSHWFSKFLGTECLLVGVPDDMMRIREITVRGEKRQMALLCQDSSPIHAVTLASIRDLSERIQVKHQDIESPVEIDRFRPNIVIGGTEPYEEEEWGMVSFSEHVWLEMRKKTGRCPVVNIDQMAANKSSGVYRTLSGYKRNDEGIGTFGVHFIPDTLGTIAVGDMVRPD
ncbi:MAG: MOSC domain-containing protein [bacterium]|nr:MOSC domain-containing protein [bacterium]